MENKKEIVDKYLTDNWEIIKRQKLEKGFKWFDVAFKIAVETKYSDFSTKDGRLLLSPEYVRGRYRLLKSKPEFIDGAWIPKIEKENLENWKKQCAEHFMASSPTQNAIFVYTSGKEDKSSGKKEFTFTASEIPTEAQIVEHFNIDLTKFKISQIWHKTTPSGKYSISVNLQALKGNQTIALDEKFIEKLNSITNTISLPLDKKWFNSSEPNKPKASLIIPKQDAHWNKSDINGDNSIEDRFKQFTQLLLQQLEKATATNTLEEIVYIIGSDEFNSEATGETTKGTPQQNILSYNQSFEKISEFNIEIIKFLRFYTPKVKVLLLNGNHDHNVSWHLAHLLKHIFKKNESIDIDDNLLNTKTYSYKTNLVLLNHGDAIKPKDLAAKFPILAKEQWSQHSNYYVLTGDKHHEISHDFNGVMWYQVPQLSNAKSKWDDKMGYNTSKPELLTFLFEEDGLSNIFRKILK